MQAYRHECEQDIIFEYRFIDCIEAPRLAHIELALSPLTPTCSIKLGAPQAGGLLRN